MTGFFHHPLFEKHLENYTHVEQPERIKVIMQKIKSGPLADKLQFIEAQPAERAWIERVHDHEYVKGILSLEIDAAVVLDWGDTVATKATPQAALYAAGAGVMAARMVLEGKLSSAFCAVRPPGHHAEADRAMGFCIFNNIAIAAADLLDTGGLSRVAILDWDIHHGNGTERMFDDNPHLLYISLHQYPHYPGTGHAGAIGVGEGKGYTLNIPMGSSAGDDDYREAFDARIIPAIDDFKPDFILISAGFDGHVDDPLSGTRLSTAMFGEMTRMVRQAAKKHCAGRIVSLLEGGYNLSAMADSVEAHLQALID
jgi:acetoin utilization deacetylase AcuC-like enzyme